jgi:hypothetical protein
VLVIARPNAHGAYFLMNISYTSYMNYMNISYINYMNISYMNYMNMSWHALIDALCCYLLIPRASRTQSGGSSYLALLSHKAFTPTHAPVHESVTGAGGRANVNDSDISQNKDSMLIAQAPLCLSPLADLALPLCMRAYVGVAPTSAAAGIDADVVPRPTGAMGAPNIALICEVSCSTFFSVQREDRRLHETAPEDGECANDESVAVRAEYRESLFVPISCTIRPGTGSLQMGLDATGIRRVPPSVRISQHELVA